MLHESSARETELKSFRDAMLWKLSNPVTKHTEKDGKRNFDYAMHNENAITRSSFAKDVNNYANQV